MKPPLLDRLGRASAVDFGCRSSTAPRSLPKRKGQRVGPSPTDRGKPGSKRHVLMDASGILLALLLSAANVHDSRLFDPHLLAGPRVTPASRLRRASRRTGPCCGAKEPPAAHNG
jgi:hypothetical protein